MSLFRLSGRLLALGIFLLACGRSPEPSDELLADKLLLEPETLPHECKLSWAERPYFLVTSESGGGLASFLPAGLLAPTDDPRLAGASVAVVANYERKGSEAGFLNIAAVFPTSDAAAAVEASLAEGPAGEYLTLHRRDRFLSLLIISNLEPMCEHAIESRIVHRLEETAA